MILRAKTDSLFSYSNLTSRQKANAQQNLSEIKGSQLVLKSLPRRIVLELTNRCNIRCIMCGRDDAEFSPTSLDTEILDYFTPALKCVEEMTLFGWGEPTIHPQFESVLKFLDKNNIRKYFVTNGMTLHRIIHMLFRYKVDILAVSLDGATEKTNNSIRIKSDFKKIVAGLKNVADQRRQKGLPYPYMNFVTTLMVDNLHEFPDMVRLAHDIGIEEVKAVYLTAFSDEMARRSLYGRADEVEQVFSQVVALAEKLDIKIKLPYLQGQDVAKDKLHKDCFVGWRDMFIGSDGYIRPCQSNSRKLFHYSEFANISEAWNSEQYRQFRAVVNTDKMWDECRSCYQSSHANWNRKSAFVQTHKSFVPEWKK